MFLCPAIGHPLLFFGHFYLFLLLLTVLFDKTQLKGIKGYPTSDVILEDVQVHKSGLPGSLHKGSLSLLSKTILSKSHGASKRSAAAF